VNFHVTVLKILVSYPDGFAVMEDLKRDMAILATGGREWADRTRRLAARCRISTSFHMAWSNESAAAGGSRPKDGKCSTSWKPEPPRPSRSL